MNINHPVNPSWHHNCQNMEYFKGAKNDDSWEKYWSRFNMIKAKNSPTGDLMSFHGDCLACLLLSLRYCIWAIRFFNGVVYEPS